MSDVGQYFGSDLQLSATGDLLVVTGIVESEQRVLRRLMTNTNDYFAEPNYGGGLPGDIGSTISVNAVARKVQSQMRLESTVAASPAPQVQVTQLPGQAMYISAQYATQNQPVTLNFTVSP